MAHTYAKPPPTADHRLTARVSMPPHAHAPNDRERASRVYSRTQIVVDGQKRVDMASVAQTQKGDPLACERPCRLSLEARSAHNSRGLHEQSIRSTVKSAIGAGTHVKERAHKAPVVLKDTSRAGKCP